MLFLTYYLVLNLFKACCGIYESKAIGTCGFDDCSFSEESYRTLLRYDLFLDHGTYSFDVLLH